MNACKAIFITLLAYTMLYSAELQITATGFRNDRGLARIAVFTSPQGFPDTFTQFAFSRSVKIVSGNATTKISGVTVTACAISVLHDEDQDGKMKKAFMGFPLEGFGVSNGNQPIFGPPKYEESIIKISQPKEKAIIKINYL